jgi:hypothetical protein
MNRLFFFAFLGIIVYFSFIKPHVDTVTDINKNDDLKKHLQVIEEFSSIDPYNYVKFQSNVKLFFNSYIQSHHYNAKSSVLLRLKRLKSKTMKYLNRIPFRLENDLHRSQKLYNAIYNINIILESYTHRTAQMLNEFYQSPYMGQNEENT